MYYKFKKEPSYCHQPCKTKNCINYYNTQYKNADEYCKPCQIKKKGKRCKI